MDPAEIFRQFGHVAPRQNPVYMGHQQPMVQYQPQMQQQTFRKPMQQPEETSDGDGSGHRIAHTLTACCRCRQVPTHPFCGNLKRLSIMLTYFCAEENAMRSDPTQMSTL